MRAIRLLLGKDVVLLRRSPALAGALIVYPLVVALLVGLVVRYAGERPRVALVAPEGLPSVLVVGKQTFDLAAALRLGEGGEARPDAARRRPTASSRRARCWRS